jgi:DNA polymerase-4
MAKQRNIMHIDANSAYLSWTADNLLKNGHPLDIRTVPSAIAGDPERRSGIILAKSFPAKRYGIKTAETIYSAKRKCPKLLLFPPDHDLFAKYSEKMFNLLSEYTDVIERFSVDECWLDYTGSEKIFGDPVETAYRIKDRMKKELGFTVNIGVSSNKILAKMGSEMEKPDKIHTLYPDQIEEKMWPLDASELFFVGRKTAAKLRAIGIRTIGDIANANVDLLKTILKPTQGQIIHDYANGIDDSPVICSGEIEQKGLGNSTTLPKDVTSEEEAFKVLLKISDKVGSRLRKLGKSASVVSVTVRNADLFFYSHQKRPISPIGTTTEIYEASKEIFREMWQGDPLRQLGISLGSLTDGAEKQLSLFDRDDTEELETIDKLTDEIRNKYGKKAIGRGL